MNAMPSVDPVSLTPPAAPEKVAPLSFAQRRLWFVQQLQPGGTAYNLPIAWRLSGELNFEAFVHSVDEIVRRHAGLRTTVIETDGEPMQAVWPWRPLEISVDDVGTAADPEAESRRFIEEEIQTPFDLKRGALFKVRLIRLSGKETIALFNAHHIVWDGWSIEVFRREFAALYTAFCRNEAFDLPALSGDYADFATEEQTAARNANWEESLGYWKEKLRAPLPRLELLHDGALSGNASKAAVIECHIDETLTKALRLLSRKNGVTFFMTLLAACKALLHRYTGEEDIIVGAPVAGRDRAETEHLIGFFVNTLALRTDLSGNPTFCELLRRVRETTLGAYAHQEVPFERIVQELQRGPQETAAAPLFPVVFGFEGGNTHRWTLGNLEATVAEIASPGAKFDWTFLLEETDCGLKGSLEYNTDLFEAHTIDRFLQHFRILLEGIVADPNRRISEIPLLADSERQRFAEWNRTATDYERDATVHQLFEQLAKKSPDAVALVLGYEQMTYGELNCRAEELATRLRQHGVGADVPVGLCLDRSMELIVAILGILKAGGAYVPLDRSYPRERLQFMLKDAGAKLLVTDGSGAQLFPDVETVEFEKSSISARSSSAFKAHQQETPSGQSARLSAANLAYVMYTSGSTGEPKGVAVSHRGIVRLVRNTNYARFSASEVFLQLAPTSFDASTLEIWGALLNGAKLVIAPPHTLSLEELGGIIQQYGVTTLWLTAGLFQQMIDEQIGSLRSVRQLLAGGDVLSVPHVMKALRELPDCQIINGYGPTENTTFTTCYRVPRNWEGHRSVPIGKPISNTQVYVLDRNLALVPEGIPGELYIGGDGLASGYINRSELTAEKFIPDPFSASENGSTSRGVLYRTGDLVRWLPDGNLEFLGRKDNQVKIRGYRVELGELESALAHHPAVRTCAAIAKEDKSGKQLVAFVVVREHGAFDETSMRQFLEQRLPGYLLPSRIIEVAELPLTQNGKVDRRALSSTEPAAGPKPQSAPRTEVERAILQIWDEVLGHDSIGIHDNFFHIGGHSLLATQVVSRIAKQFHVALPVSAVFESPTIAGLAERIASADAARDPVGRIVPQNRANRLLSQLDALSDAEVEALLHSPELNQVSS